MIIPLNSYTTFIAGFGSSKTGKTVQYQILNHDLTVLSAFTATGIQEIGNGQYGVRISFANTFQGYIQWKNVTDNVLVADPITVVENFLTQINKIYKVETGRWKILNNQMVFYDDDTTTPLLTFNLKDSSGNPTEENPTERTPV
jgi:hypothetical protein